MIGVFEALDWLNAIDDRSRLTRREVRLIMNAQMVSLSDDEVTSLLESLRNDGLASVDPLERAEVLLHIAAIEYWRRRFPEAARDAGAANQTYRSANDTHRRAVASWILGMAHWELLQNNEAYTNWSEARTAFEQGQDIWYQRPLRRMQIDFVALPEEISTWLNVFQGSRLTQSSWQVIRMVQENIRRRRYSSANEVLADLQEINRWTRNPYELPEACIVCALTAYQEGPAAIAIRLIEKAILDFAPGIGNNHRQVIARCMLGALEGRDTSRQKNARLCWTRCLDELDELELLAVRENNRSQQAWYAERRSLLESAIADRFP